MVDIDHEQSKFLPPAFRSFELQFQLLLKITPGPQTGEVISKGKPQQSFIGIFSGEKIFGNQRKNPEELSVLRMKAIILPAKKLERANHAVAHKQRNGQRRVTPKQVQLRIGFRIVPPRHQQRPRILDCPEIKTVAV